jgi:radical SAM superfamily enzyme YgiQ (UPF0313 family)
LRIISKTYLMDYQGHVIRPPSEADSIILQVTVGCSYNKCTFCGAYKEVDFTIKTSDAWQADLAWAAQYCRQQRRVFLADGDVLALPQHRLVQLFSKINEVLPWISRISLYGSSRSVQHKSLANLQQLKNLGLDRIYMGLESGSDEVLKRVNKGSDPARMIDAAQKVREAAIFLSVTALLGLGGRELSEIHALETAKVLAAMAPRQIALLTLMVLDNTDLGREMAAGRFCVPDSHEILDELYLLLSNLQAVTCQFHANHASSYLPLSGRLPRDRSTMLRFIDEARKGKRAITPETWRAL